MSELDEQTREFLKMEKFLLQEFAKVNKHSNKHSENMKDMNDFQDIENDPLLAPDFDVIQYLNQNFQDESSLEKIQTQIQSYDKMLVDLDFEIKECIRDQAYAQDQTRDILNKINSEAAVLIDKFEQVKTNARESQEIVESGCQEIRKLDSAKKNISHAITTLKKLNMLIVGIEQQRDFCINKQYKEAGDLIRETGHLLGYFFKQGNNQIRRQAYGIQIIHNQDLDDENQENESQNQKDFSDIEELKSLKDEWDHLCNQLRIQILEEFENLEKGIKQEDLLQNACIAIDSMGLNAINDIKMQFSNFILHPYQEIFEPGKPDSEFENIRRRFSWLKRTLKEYNEKYESIFPYHWHMKHMIAMEFCRQTKLHIDEILSLQHLKIDVSKLIEILQATIEFEIDIQSKFEEQNIDQIDDYEQQNVIFGENGKVQVLTGTAEEIKKKYQMGQKQENVNEHKNMSKKQKQINQKQNLQNYKPTAPLIRFKGCISEVFEPYLKSYSESEEKKIIEALEQVVGANDKLETLEHTVYSSSLRLFKNIKDSMRRCISFSTSKALFDLHTSFKNVMRHYQKLLQRQMPTKYYDINYETIKYGLPGSTPSIKSLPDKPMSDEVEMKCVYIINTCEYILDIVPQLQNSIEDKIDQEYLDKVDLSNFAEDVFKDLIRASINCLVVSLCARNDKIYSQTLVKINWQEFQMQGAIESSQYMKEIAAEMQNRVASIKQELAPVYFSFLMKKLASALPSNYLLNVYKIKKSVSSESSQQFLYDIQNELKSMLYGLPLIQLDQSGKIMMNGNDKSSESYRTFVDKSIQKVMGRFKVMGYPADPSIIRDGYQQILDQIDKNDKNKSKEDLVAILTLRGLATKSNEIKQHLDKFENWINSLS